MSKVINNPGPDRVKDILGEAKRRNACMSVYTRCHVAYEGRAQSQLAAGDRFVLIKPDGTLLIHGKDGQEPRNWQPPGATVQITATDPLTILAVRTTPKEAVKVTCEETYHAALMPMEDDSSVKLRGSESDLRERIFDSPSLIEEGFVPKVREYDTPAGPVDILGEDNDGQPVLCELKRNRTGPDAVSQLNRYVESSDTEVRGILVAPSITDQAKELLTEYQLEYRSVAPPTDTESHGRSLIDFVDE